MPKTPKPKLTPVAQATNPLPHSWTIPRWPASVAPGNGAEGARLIRANKTALIEAGAISRIGRKLIVFGKGWEKWCALQANRVFDYDMAPNQPEHASKRRNQQRGAA